MLFEKTPCGAAFALTLLLLFSAACAKKAEPAPEQAFQLTVLHTNDTHSLYGGSTAQGSPCYESLCRGGKGGRVRMLQAVQAVQRQSPENVFLDAGDIFQGSLYWTEHQEVMPVALLDRMGYAAIAPGNHEFDAGCKPFLQMAQSLKTPFTAANLSFDPPLPGSDRVRPWVIVRRGGRDIGIIGLANARTPSMSSPCAEARFADEAESLRAVVKDLSARGVDIIMALTHVGLEKDKALARAVPGVDVIVGGHSHSLLSNILPRAEGPYPVVERSPEGKPVLIVTAAWGSVYLGRLDVGFDAGGVPVSWKGEPLLLDAATLAGLNAPPPDAELVRIIDDFSKPVQHMTRKKAGEIKVRGKGGSPLEQDGVMQCRKAECLTGNIVAGALWEQAFPEAQAVLINGGCLRNSLPVGTVSVGDVLATLPFRNRPVLAAVPGARLLEALEHSAAAQGDGAFLQSAGLRYAFDPARAPGQRVVKAEIRQKNGQWEPVRKDAVYAVASLDFLANGGSGYDMFKGLAWKESSLLLHEALLRHLDKKSPLMPRLEGRVECVRQAPL